MAKSKLNNLEKSSGDNGNCRLNPLENCQVTNGNRRLNNLAKIAMYQMENHKQSREKFRRGSGVTRSMHSKRNSHYVLKARPYC
jgi:hypothetical protein